MPSWVIRASSSPRILNAFPRTCHSPSVAAEILWNILPLEIVRQWTSSHMFSRKWMHSVFSSETTTRIHINCGCSKYGRQIPAPSCNLPHYTSDLSETLVSKSLLHRKDKKSPSQTNIWGQKRTTITWRKFWKIPNHKRETNENIMKPARLAAVKCPADSNVEMGRTL